jgi:integrase
MGANYLQKASSGILYFRRAIPGHLIQWIESLSPAERDALGIQVKREFRRTLKTRDRQLALKRLGPALAECDQFLFALERIKMDFDDIIKAAKRGMHYKVDRLSLNDDGRVELEGVETDPSNPKDHAALLELVNLLKSARGAVSAKPAPELQPTAGTQVVSETPPTCLSHHFEAFLDYQSGKKGWREPTRRDAARKLGVFIELSGDPSPLEITPKRLAELVELMTKLPTHVARRYKGMTIRDAISAEEKRTKKKQSFIEHKTLEKYIGATREFFAYLVKTDIIEATPFESNEVCITDIIGPKKKTKNVKTYSLEQLTTLFTGQQYVTHIYNHDWQYWMPLLGAFTGARVNELAQLHLSDVTVMDGINIIDINADAPEETQKRLKSSRSARRIPLHSKLVELGFLDFVASRRKEAKGENVPLFSTLKYHQKSGYGQYVTKWFSGTYKKARGFYAKDGYSFHTFRKTFATRLYHEHEVPKPAIQALVGHDDDEVLDQNYLGDYTVSRLNDYLQRLDLNPALSEVKPFGSARVLTEKERRSRKTQK